MADNSEDVLAEKWIRVKEMSPLDYYDLRCDTKDSDWVFVEAYDKEVAPMTWEVWTYDWQRIIVLSSIPNKWQRS